MASYPFVSIIIPSRNEEAFIKKCLLSIIENDYPKEKLEILVIDGKSKDKTRKIVEKIAKEHHFIKIYDNPKKTTPTALNIGIKHSRGDIIMRMDAHSVYKKNYISLCVKYLKKYQADNVGGLIKTVPSKNTIIAESIATALSSKFGVGGSKFRTGSKKSIEVDTVAFGCYRKTIFKKIGLFNEKLKRSQDIEFNLRLKKRGGKIILFPKIICLYFPPESFLSFLKHSFIDGIWSTYPIKFTKNILSLRHYTPLIFVIALASTAILSQASAVFKILFISISALYILMNIACSTKIAITKRDFLYLFTMPIIFATLHLSYGFGSLIGLLKIPISYNK